MKRLSILAFSLLLSVFLAGCGNDSSENTGTDSQNTTGTETDTGSTPADSGTTDSSNSDSKDEVGSQDDMTSKMDELAFSEIKVEVSYGKNQEYEAEIEQDSNQPLEAEVEDELNGVYMKGQEAFDDIYSKAEKMDITTDSSEQDIIDQVLSAFDLEANYEKIEIDITFNDGTVREFESRKQ